MHRFFVPKEDIYGDEIVIRGEDLKHIKNVLRLKEGEEVSVCDGDETDYIAKIESVGKDEIILSVQDSFRSEGEPPIDLKIYQGLPKGDKLELIIQKCTELGVKEIIPVTTKRSVVKLSDKKKTDKKLERWSKIAEEASKQSKRGRIPVVDRVLSMKEALSEVSEDELVVMLYEAEDQKSFKAALEGYGGKRISVFIGPEGGFDDEEVELLRDSGAEVVSLGKRILRTETAGLTASAIIMYELGDLGVI